MTEAVSVGYIDAEIVILSSLIVIFAVASLFSKDNFYSALYMCLTVIMIAGLYACYGIHSAFALLVLIFIGAVGAITLILSYTYREVKSIEYRLGWIFVSIVVGLFTALSLPALSLMPTNDYVSALIDFEPVYMLFALSVLLLLTLIEVWRDRC
ncbi:hypothetical protein [Archaeoglobus sp.]